MSVIADRSALRRLLGGPDTAWLVDRVRARLPAEAAGPLRGVVRLDAPTEAQRAAVVRLVGPSRRPGSALRVDLAVVEDVLRRSVWPAGLTDAVETLTGPVVDHAAARREEAAGWSRVAEALAPHTGQSPALSSWWEAWQGAGGLKRAARAEARRVGVAPTPEVGESLVTAAAAVLAELPASGEPLALLARRSLGDAHGLDASRPLGRLMVALVDAAYPPATPAPVPRSRREVWAAVGVLTSRVASTALCLGVPGRTSGRSSPIGEATAVALEAWRQARVPSVLTLDQVASGGVAPLLATSVVHVCENPTVVELVASRWRTAPPTTAAPVVVCTAGQPSLAVVELLARLTSAGAGCRYHGDFDWAGLRIARGLRARVPWDPWRFGAADYLRAVGDDLPALPLSGPAADSPWDPALAEAMLEHGLAVEEEAVVEDLVADVLA